MLENKDKNLRLRPIEESDLDWLRELHNDESVIVNLTDRRYVSKDQQRRWFENNCNSPTSMKFMILIDIESSNINGSYTLYNSRVGIFKVDFIDYVNGSAWVGADIHHAFRRRGYATQAYTIMLNYLFNNLRLNRVALSVLESNIAGWNAYKKLGFVEEGRDRKAIYRDGKYLDYIRMSILKDEFIGV